MKTNENYKSKSVKVLVKDKMRVLADFGICDRRDEEMIQKLCKAIAAKPDKDPREVLDYYCRPIIQAKANSWN